MCAENTVETMLKLQAKTPEHSYFCKDMSLQFDKINATDETKQETIKDFLSIADRIMVVGNIVSEMCYILDFANELKMEVEYLENAV